MKDKKRLEMLENGSSFSSDDITFLLKQARLYQISRDDTREKCHEVKEQNKELEQQNNRYREGLEKIAHVENGFHPLAIEARMTIEKAEALEGEE